MNKIQVEFIFLICQQILNAISICATPFSYNNSHHALNVYILKHKSSKSNQINIKINTLPVHDSLTNSVSVMFKCQATSINSRSKGYLNLYKISPTDILHQAIGILPYSLVCCIVCVTS